MYSTNMPVAERIAAIKTIFKDFGIPVPDNSVLDQTIRAEFGRGKRSKLNKILLGLNQSSEAATLAICIGTAMQKYADEPDIAQISVIMCTHLPAVLHIIDLCQQTTKRFELLDQLLQHFESKLSQAERLVQMLSSSRALLRDTVQVQAIGDAVEKIGTVVELQDLQRCGRLLQIVSSALVALDNPHVELEQKINLSVQALAVMGLYLKLSNLSKAASIIDTLHCLAQIALPISPDLPTIEQALQNLDLSLGTITIINLRNKARALGLTDTELSQVLYTTKQCSVLAAADKELLDATKENKQYAAACGLLAKLGQDIGCGHLERVGVAGICLISMRQTYCEIKTNSLTAANFSESLGTIISSVAVLSNNKTLAKIGSGIIEGVKTYAGISAVPGGSIIAIPLAICSVLSKLLLGSRSRKARKNTVTSEVVLQHLLGQVQQLQIEMRSQFSGLYELAHIQHQELLNAMQQAFASLASYTQAQVMRSTLAVKTISSNLDFMHTDLSKKFGDLYREYVYSPIEEIHFFSEYKQADVPKLRANKLKLSMWLLFKSKNPKANGLDLIANFEGSAHMSSYISSVLSKATDYDSALGMVNRYVNLEFAQSLPEDLPHIPTWILAADQYVLLLSDYAEHLDLKASEPKILHDIIKVGEQLLSFVQQLAGTDSVLAIIVKALETQYTQAQLLFKQSLAAGSSRCLRGIEQLLGEYKTVMITKPMLAESAPEEEQLENFTPFRLDLSAAWYLYILKHVPAHILMAVDFALGELSLKLAIDKKFNNFATAKAAAEYNLLPDSARYVLYRIDVYFVQKENAQRTLILNAWFAYDLCSLDKRRAEYFSPKYLGSVTHSSHRWPRLNSASANIARTINLDGLAKVYQDWWPQALPVNTPEILARLKNHTEFYCKNHVMLDRGLCVDLKFGATLFLQMSLQVQVQNIMLSQRRQIASSLLENKALEAVLEKIDVYGAVLTVFKQLVNMPVSRNNLSKQLQQLVGLMQEGTAINQDLEAKLRDLLDSSAIALNPSSNYKNGAFYQKINYTLSQLALLPPTLPTLGLGL